MPKRVKVKEPVRRRKVRHIIAMISDDWKDVPDDIKPLMGALSCIDSPEDTFNQVSGLKIMRRFVNEIKGRYQTHRSRRYIKELNGHIWECEIKMNLPLRQHKAEQAIGTRDLDPEQADES